MARSKRWTIPFKSLNGTDCRIDIYDEGWSGSVTEISTNNVNTPGYAAANPIEWQENDEENLLHVLRYKTGYIRMYEASNGSLNDLYPQTNTEHYVEFYYDSTLMFTGYIQAQSFDNEFIAAPRLVELPIISPVGVSQGIKMNTVTPGNVNIGSLLQSAITKLNAAYTHVVFPESTPAFAGNIKSIIAIPFNDDFDYLESGANDVYEPKYISELLEGICNAYGWILHDEPYNLSFSKFDHNGSYVKIWNTDLAIGTTVSEVTSGNTSRAFGDYYSISGNNGIVKTILPVKEIEMDFGQREWTGDSYKFARIGYVRQDALVGGTTAAIWMKGYGPELTGAMDSNTLTAWNSLSNYGVNICAIGRPEKMQKMVLIYMPANSRDDYLFTCRLYNVPKHHSGGVTFKIDGMVGKDLYFEDNGSCIVQCSIRAGSKYLNYNPEYIGANSWVNSEVKNFVYINAQQNLIPMTVHNIPECEYIEFKFYSYPLADDLKFIGLTEIGVQAETYMADEFDVSQTESKKFKSDNGSDEKANINIMMSCQREFLNFIGTTPQPFFTDYSYMFLSQTRLKVTCKRLNSETYPYFVKWTYWVSGWHWRIISISFDPWNENYVIILHRSSTI